MGKIPVLTHCTNDNEDVIKRFKSLPRMVDIAFPKAVTEGLVAWCEPKRRGKSESNLLLHFQKGNEIIENMYKKDDFEADILRLVDVNEIEENSK